jgi:hypothetical protein
MPAFLKREPGKTPSVLDKAVAEHKAAKPQGCNIWV